MATRCWRFINRSKFTTKAERRYFRQWKDKGIEVAVEAGGHTRWIYDRLTMGVSVYVVNPLKVKLIAETKKKTDKADAKILADLLRTDGLPAVRVHRDRL